MYYFFDIIKQRVPLRYKCRIQALIHPDNKWLQYASVTKQRIFVFVSGFYQNLGDLAITYAQVKFINRIVPNSVVVVVPVEETFSAIPMIKKYIRENDVVTLIGGGNMSDMYCYLETARREVILKFPNNRIISFPQTAYFTNSKNGKKELAISRRLYSNHPDLYLFAREKESYIRMRTYFPKCEISLVPDIVLSLDRGKTQVKRNGILVCLREDKEQYISDSFRDGLIRAINDLSSNVVVTDTTKVDLKDCQPDTYEKTIEVFLRMIESFQVVLTDRLHCMIFCALTGTPCVVMDNSNHKVKSFYESWFCDCNWINYIDTRCIDSVIQVLADIYNSDDKVAYNSKWVDSFVPLINACINKTNVG